MKSRRARAVDLLMGNQPEQVAKMVGVRLITLESWMKMNDFRDALASREREHKRSLARLARQAAVNAAETLCTVAANRTKPDAKILLEIIKASGAFEPQTEDSGDSLAEVIRRLEEEDDNEN